MIEVVVFCRKSQECSSTVRYIIGTIPYSKVQYRTCFVRYRSLTGVWRLENVSLRESNLRFWEQYRYNTAVYW